MWPDINVSSQAKTANVYQAGAETPVMARILKNDRFQKGEDVIASNYATAREAIKAIKQELFS